MNQTYNYGNVKEHKFNHTFIKGIRKQRKLTSLHYPHDYTTLMMSRVSPLLQFNGFSSPNHQFSLNPNSHNLTKLILKYVRCNLMIYRLNISER
jgi:hypothetical protein